MRDEFLRQERALIDASGHTRRRLVVEPTTLDCPVEIRVNNHPCINFCSNDYLGLSSHPAVRQALVHCAMHYPIGSGAAHLVSGHHPEHHALEEELADFCGRARAVLFSTGYMANLSIASAFLRRGDRVFEDRLNHASLIDAGLNSGAHFRRFTHANMAALSRLLNTTHTDSPRTLVLTDAVFSMDGDQAPLQSLATLCHAQQAWLMVDDAHGFGVLGPQGRGSVHAAALSASEVPIYMATLGKAVGVFGAFIAGSEDLIELLIQKARTYIYTTALPPALAAASRAALKVVREEDWRRTHLHAHIARFKQGAAALGLTLSPSATAIQPLIIGDARQAVTVSETLLAQGFFVTAIRPPTVPTGTARLRITLSAAHTETHIDNLLNALADCVLKPPNT